MVGTVQNNISPRFQAMLLKLSPEKVGTLHVFPLQSAPASYPDDAFILMQEHKDGTTRQAVAGRAGWVEEASRTLPNLESKSTVSAADRVEAWRDAMVDGFEEGLIANSGSPQKIFQWEANGPSQTASELFEHYEKTADFSKLLNDRPAASFPWVAMDPNVSPHEGLVLVPTDEKPNAEATPQSRWSINNLLDKLFLRNEPESKSSYFQLNA